MRAGFLYFNTRFFAHAFAFWFVRVFYVCVLVTFQAAVKDCVWIVQLVFLIIQLDEEVGTGRR